MRVLRDRPGNRTSIIVLMVVALLGTACGSDTGSNGEAVTTSVSETTSPTTAATAATGDTSPAPDDDENEGALIIGGEVIADAETWSAAQQEGGLTVYTGFGADNEAAIAADFEEATGLSVEIIRLAAGPLMERIASERAAGIFLGDVFRLGEYAFMVEMNAAGALQPHKVEAWDDLPDEVKFDEGLFYIWLQSAYSIGYNTERVSPEDAPESWLDLLDERWQGDIAIPDIAAGGSTLSLYQFLPEVVAPDYLERLASNDPRILGGSGAVTSELASGEVAVAMVLPGSIAPTMREGAPITWIVPAEGIPLYENFMGMMEGGPNPNAARVFMNYMLSLTGQEFLSQQLGVYPVRPGVPPPSVLDRTMPTRDETLLWEQDQDKTLEVRESLSQEWYITMDYNP